MFESVRRVAQTGWGVNHDERTKTETIKDMRDWKAIFTKTLSIALDHASAYDTPKTLEQSSISSLKRSFGGLRRCYTLRHGEERAPSSMGVRGAGRMIEDARDKRCKKGK